MRIAFGGIHIECSTYNPVLTEYDEFRVFEGAALLNHPSFAFLQDYDAEFIPTLHARAIPGGPVAKATYLEFKNRFLAELKQALPVDGVYLAMHGAMYVEGMEDAEADWVSATRELVGPDCPISASYDLHGNVSQTIIDQLNAFSAYRTAPHIDIEETMRRSVSMLVNSITTGVTPKIYWCPIPVVLAGEQTSTEDEPAASLYAQLPEIDKIDGVWDASLLVGYVWADEPRATACAVLTGTDDEVLKQQAKVIANSYWQAREAFRFGCQIGTVSECVAWAIDCSTYPVILADSGDNPTGGGVGDRGDVLAELIKQKATSTLVAGIADKAATIAAFDAGVGAKLTLSVGASLDPSGVTVHETFKVKRLIDATADSARQAILSIGGIDVVVCERRRPYHNLSDFALLGVNVKELDTLVVKSGYLSPDLAPLANPNLMALSEGVVDQYVERIPRLRKQKLTFPFDREFTYTPEAKPSAQNR